MGKKIIIAAVGIVFGFILSLGFILLYPRLSKNNNNVIFSRISFSPAKEVIGFLPYWLLDNAKPDYSDYITTLAYFGLRVTGDGTIAKLATPQQAEPGWEALHSGRLDPFFQNAKKNNINLSLIISSGSVDAINGLISDPVAHAHRLESDIAPLMNKYGFSDVNFDIEYTQQASKSAQNNFIRFIKEFRNILPSGQTITVEISPTDSILPMLINVKAIGEIADHVVIMAYDYHSTESFVSGPVSPLAGAGITSEYDVTTAAIKVLQKVPAQKIILGVPLYGYEWETLASLPRSAIIPGSGVVASNRRSKELIVKCATCSARLDQVAQEEYMSYFDQNTHTYHIVFYPNTNAMLAKIHLANIMHFGGMALWALGYDGNNILRPFISYKNK